MLQAAKYINTHALWVWQTTFGSVIEELGGCRDLPWPKLTNLHVCTNAIDHDYVI